MASSILNSDDGVVSGTSGLKTSGGDDGILKIQTNGTDAVSVTGSQVCSFANNFGTVANLPAYQCRAWVSFDGTTATPSTIRGSGNVSSVTKNGTGDYTVNFTTSMPDSDYAVVLGCATSFGVTGQVDAANSGSSPTTQTTSTVRVTHRTTSNGTLTDIKNQYVAIFR